VSEAQIEDAKAERDVLAIAKTIAANEFPVERASVIGVDRESGRLLRLSPFPWKGNDTDPPLLRWSWIHARTLKDERDVRFQLSGEVRWEWEHSIAPMDVTRRSVTFRTLR